MKRKQLAPRLGRAIILGVLTLAAGACAQSGVPNDEHVGEARSDAVTNGDFEVGTAGTPPSGWTVRTWINNSITVQSPQTYAGLDLQAGGVANTVILSAAGAGPGSKGDQAIGNLLKWPRYGQQAAIVNGPNSSAQNTTGAHQNVNELTQTMTIGPGDVDPADGQVHIRLTVAPVLQNPVHTATQQPYYFVQVSNLTKGTTLYHDFNLSGAGIPWQTTTIGGNQIDFTDWQLIDVEPGPSGVSMGDSVQIQLIAAGCSPGAHWGEMYVDGVSATIPGLSVQATGPAQANPGATVTYTVTYRNGSTSTACTTSANCSPTSEACVSGVCAETGAVVTLTTPGNTTFSSITPPPGVTCSNPAAGATGTSTCTFTNPVSPGATGTITYTVTIPGGTTGSVTLANYGIKSTQETNLLGTPVTTAVGCTVDTGCSTGNWCNETAAVCTPTLANGSAVPIDVKHTNPILNGTCTAANQGTVGPLVCSSTVCDTGDSKCGYANGDGPCTATNGATVCRSGVCDPDLKCGYAIGDGPCTTATQATVCRSGKCSSNGLCEPLGGCNVDADCTAGNWCNETTHACTVKLINGTSVPIDAAHSNPTLNGTCTTAAAVTVCQSGVCDTSDNKCGYVNGDGPCTMSNGITVCRSALCSANGTCEPLGGCNVDADCTAGNWCNETTHACTAKLGNGVALPSDPPHSNPTLNGSCTTAASALVCLSGVCDTRDNECGYANEDGPCTTANQATVCRSATCSSNGLCEPLGGCNVDADCTAGNWCNETSHACTAKLTNGTSVPTDAAHSNPTLNGTCTTAAAVTVCQSGVCDTGDNKCGYAIGDGPCTSGATGNGATVCRSGVCSANGTCEPLGGCNVDTDCSSGNWCNEGTHTCTPKLGNGTAIPTDTGRPATIGGTCTTTAAGVVCQSGVCDADNKCGYLNGDGTCSVATGGIVCRSGACDPDLKCGYANGDGPCTAINAATVCRSQDCANDNLCVASGGCDVDADCTAGNWCQESTHTCTPKLANGTAIPSDAPHTNPTLNGTCTVTAGALVCTSSVCDTTDGKCGFANGDGPCTLANGPTVCRSGQCSADLHCVAAGGCDVDADCTGGNWCNETTHACTPKLTNGTALPTDAKHTSPTLDGTCNPTAGALVCQSGVCDSTDNRCGYANEDGPCSAANAALVCRSGACSLDLRCEPVGGCNVDGDCSAGNWCRESTHTCSAKLANGTALPTDAPHTAPTLDGTCTTAAAILVCQSGVCDMADNKCGEANGDGPCTVATAPTVCRSGVCSTNGTCAPAGGCNVDGDCAAGKWCNETAHLCSDKLTNGTAIPTDAPHTTPTLDGTCTTAAAVLVCQSAVCDTKDSDCGYADGDGPCTIATGSVVCRSGACSQNGTCEKAGGCNVDLDCSKGSWCQESTHTCTPQLANGSMLPVDAPHTNPTLDGTCSTAAALVVCQSGVCDATDSECGLANGDGPCDPATAVVVCRSGACSTNGMCEPVGGCNVDADCAAGNWCNAGSNACVPTLANGTPVPTDAKHASPTLDGTCTSAAGALVCTSGVCDATDNECGLANGDGPCDPTNGSTVCRSQLCGTTGNSTGLCVGCTTSSDCSGATPVCNTSSGNCVQCTDSTQCSNGTPVCDGASDACVPCNGDNGSTSSEACPTGDAPFCFLSGSKTGQCGKCSADTDCNGHAADKCDTTTGLCASGCHVDSDCTTGEWCDADGNSLGMCQPKLDNGQPLPKSPSDVATCSATVGTRVCFSGVCDPKDDTCGLATGDGTCSNDEQCRNDHCDEATKICEIPPSGCKSDSDCSKGEQCVSGVCKQPVVKPPVVTAAGGGPNCSAQPASGDSNGGLGATAFGLLLTAFGLARRRRR